MAGDGKSDGASEAALGWMILLAVMGVVVYLVWWYNAGAIKNTLRWIRYAEMQVVSVFVDNDYALPVRSPDGSSTDIKFDSILERTPDLETSELDGYTLGIITTAALYPIRWVVMIIIGLIGLWAFRKGPGTQYREKYNINGLISAQSGNFPVIAPFVRFDPSTIPPRPPGSPVPAELPLFAEALGPEEWLAYYGIPVPDGHVDEKAAWKAFAKQLGPRWKGAQKLKPYKQILLASFCLKAARKRGDSDDMLGRLAACWSHNKGLQLGKDKTLLRDARKVLSNKDLAHGMLKKCSQHGWQTTALMRALQVARQEGGVLAPAQFVWMRGHDRTLWYPLNNVGRQSLHMEAIGAQAHFKAEKLAQRPIPSPKVDDAVTSIVDYMLSDRSRPIPQLDYSNSKKRGVKKQKTS